MFKINFLLTATLLFCCSFTLFAQSPTTTTVPPIVQPDSKVLGYIGVVHPLVTFQGGKKPAYNFGSIYTVGVPVAVIIKRSPKFAFNIEMVPFVRRQSGVQRVANLLIHPGVTFYLKNNFAFTPRLGFETNGRYGFSTVFSKTVWKGKYNNFAVNVPILFRFGQTTALTTPIDKASATVALNLTCGF
jgi:hypothetical protein